MTISHDRATKETLEDGTPVHIFTPAGQTRPDRAVILFHERYGLVEHTLDLGAKLADDGLLALTPDLFEGRIENYDAVRSGDVRVDIYDGNVVRTADACLSLLKGQFDVGASAVAVMGVCQSGRHPICVANATPSIGAAVVFYGAAQDRDWPVDEEKPVGMHEMLTNLDVPLFATFAEADHVISLDNVFQFRNALEQGRRGYRIRVQPDAPHGFMDSTKPGRYRPQATAESWSALLQFLDETLPRDPAEDGADRVLWEFSADISRDYDFSRNVRLE